jgi:hypothetical protein
MSVCLSVYLTVYLSAYLSVYQPVCLSWTKCPEIDIITDDRLVTLSAHYPIAQPSDLAPPLLSVR